MAHVTTSTLSRAVPVNHTAINDAPPLEGDFKAVVSRVAAELRTVLNSMPGVIVPSRIAHDLRTKVEDPLKKERAVDRVKATSYLNKINGAITSLHAELGSEPDPTDVRLRQKALEILGKAIRDLKVEDPRKIAAENTETRRKQLEHTNKPTEEYVGWLADSMRYGSPMRWSASNVIGVLFSLSIGHREWRSASRADEVLRSLAERLYATSKENGVKISGMDLINLTGSTPTVVDALKQKWNKDPEIEKKFFEGAARLVQAAEAGPGRGEVEKKFLKPLSVINTSVLTPEGAVAACRYAAAVQDVIANLPGSEELRNIAAQFRALKGITNWHQNAETQGYLTNTFKDLVDRLKTNKETGNSRMLGEILYGLRGVHGAALSDENQNIVAQVIKQVAIRMQRLPEVPHIGAVSAMIHGVSPCFSAEKGELRFYVNALMAAIENRLPEPPTTMTDLGYACATLVALSGHRRQFTRLIDSMWKDVVEKTNFFEMSSSRMNDGDLIAWRVIQQAYGVYERPMPQQLERRLASLRRAVMATDTTSRSENRIAEYFRAVPGVSMLETRFVNGFEIDLAFRVDGREQPINVEVDGHHHDESVQEYFDRVRDDRLEAEGWRVVRVGTKFTQAEAHQLVAGLRRESVE